MRRIVKSLTTCTAAGMLLAAGANGTVCQSRQDGQCLPRKSKYGGAARNTGDEPDTQCRAWSFETRTTCNAGHNHFRERGPRKVSSAAQAQRMTSPTCPSMLGFVKSFCGISDFFLKILPFQSKFPLPHALMSCKAIYF